MLTKIKGNLKIKYHPSFFNSFCFVDPDSDSGKAFLIPMIPKTNGGERPVIYLTKKNNNDFYYRYYDSYIANIYANATEIWPNDPKGVLRK
jgi:hypothetical protein